jgi:EamA domain-containing membrane protein RarD
MASSDFAIIIGFIVLLAIVLALLALLYVGWDKENVRQFVMDQFKVIVCLPAAGLFAFLVVAIFQVSAGQIQFKILESGTPCPLDRDRQDARI